MAAVPKALYRAAPASTAAQTVTVPAGLRWIVTSVVVQSSSTTTSSQITIALDGIWLCSQVIPATGLFVLDCKQVLDAGKVLSVTSSVASTLNVNISGVEQGV